MCEMISLPVNFLFSRIVPLLPNDLISAIALHRAAVAAACEGGGRRLRTPAAICFSEEHLPGFHVPNVCRRRRLPSH